jgi:3-methyladenine DNA glycosylase AlkC
LDALEVGCVESRTHVEQMCMSMSKLAARAFPDVKLGYQVDDIPFIARFRFIGHRLNESLGDSLIRSDICWVSDTVRGWIAMAVAADRGRPLRDVLIELQPFARDHHFAVREWAWLAARPAVVESPREAVAVLRPYFSSADAYDRRFAVELTRPRSVWGRHIDEFKRHPELVEDTLALLMCDPHRYVRRSVANWLRDASRSRPDWTQKVAQAWRDECACSATTDIVRGTFGSPSG